MFMALGARSLESASVDNGLLTRILQFRATTRRILSDGELERVAC